MIPRREMYARVVISLTPTPEEQRLRYRKERYRRRMEIAGVRPASIARYLTRGFGGPFSRALRREVEQLALDMKYRRRII